MDTPAIDGIVAVSSAMLGRDVRAWGRTLASLGLGHLDPRGLRASAEEGTAR